MDDLITTRLDQLRAERDKARDMLSQAQQQAEAMSQLILRLNGAIQVLEELTADNGDDL